LKHDLHIRGFAFGLRPITLEDAEFIVQLRSDPERTRFLHPVPLAVEAQRAYLKQYFDRENDYYFVIECHRDNSREGLVGIYDVDLQERAGEWGRWILRPGSLAAVESALRIYEAAFEHLHLEQIYSHTFLDNRSVVSFHDHCGLSQRAVRRGYYTIQGRSYDAVEHVLNRCDWPHVRPLLEPRARMIAQRMEHG
jgi:RimJ/RimL family protein N-acetyltransferase